MKSISRHLSGLPSRINRVNHQSSTGCSNRTKSISARSTRAGFYSSRQPSCSRVFSSLPSRRYDRSFSTSTTQTNTDDSHKQPDKRIYILGLGAIGKLIAHSLRNANDPPPVTLLAHRLGIASKWRKSRQEIVVEQHGHRIAQSGFDMELALPSQRLFNHETSDVDHIYNHPEGLAPHEAVAELKEKEQEMKERDSLQEEFSDTLDPFYQPVDEQFELNEPISHLIVAVKAYMTISALTSVKHRLSPASTICFLQNGMGIIEEINKFVFPDPKTRPEYMLGIITHGATTPRGADYFYVAHSGHGTIALTVLPRTERSTTDITTPVIFKPSSLYLMRTLTRIPVLAAIGMTTSSFLQQRLEKLAVNSVINPMTSLLDTRNGAMNFNFALTKVQRLLLAEIALVIQSLPELKGLPNIRTRFSTARLETIIVSIATQTKDNVSSMLTDMRNGSQTEIKYLNGYIVEAGRELGVNCICNYMLTQMVLAKSKVVQDEARTNVLVESAEDLHSKI